MANYDMDKLVLAGFDGEHVEDTFTMEGVKIDMSNQATLNIGGTAVNLWQRNMFAVKAEIEVGFRADTTVFNKITE